MKGLKLRNATARDMEVVLEFCRRTWPGYGDYVPRVWQKWIDDPGGRFIVAEMHGAPVGIAKVTDFGDGEVWLEGLRVDRRHRHRGIANEINLEVLRTVRKMKPRVVRFCTGAPNRASRRMGEKAGMKIVARTRYYWEKSRKGKVRGDWARKRDVDRVYEFMLASKFTRLMAGLVAEGWIFRELTRPLVEAYVREKRVLVVRKGSHLESVAVYPFEENDEALTLGFVDGTRQGIKTLARNVKYLAEAKGYGFCSVAVPTRGYARVVEEAGYRRKDSVGQVVFEIEGRSLRSGGRGAGGGGSRVGRSGSETSGGSR